MKVRCLVARDITLQELDDFTACFSRETGATVVLDAVTATVAKIILERGKTPECDVVDALAVFLEDSAKPVAETVREAVDQLVAERLVSVST